MNKYQTLSQATNALQKKGFTEDFNQWPEERLLNYITERDIEIIEFHRFEGTSDMGSNTILYALETSDGHKGVLIDAYGTYAGQTVSKKVVKELEIHRKAYKS